jgi:hypothetical protein
MKKKIHKNPEVDDLKSLTQDILDQKKLENSALRKILEFLEKENKQINNKKNNDNSSNNKQIKG